MVALKFTLTPAASAQLHGAIQCLSRFNDTVSLEAREDSFTLTALNSSKSAHAAISFDLPVFTSYEFLAATGQLDSKFTCSISNKALLSVFKSRSSDAKSSNATERCEVTIQDGPTAARCRLVARNICSNGVVKTYKLTYEAADVMHALFDRSASTNTFAIRASFLKENLDYFSPKVEQLDIFHIDDKMTFLSFTNKIVTAKNEILKQPLKTTVILNVSDFEQLEVQEKLHIVISVKDFKAIVLHADSLDATIDSYYSVPGRALQFHYRKGSMDCQFTLMTAGEYKGPPEQATKNASPRKNPQNTESPSKLRQQTIKVMPPPPRPEGRRNTRTLGRRQTQETTSSKDSEPLFVDAEERDWDPPNYNNDGEESLGWNPNEETESLYARRLREREEQRVPLPDFPAVDSLEGEETQEMLEPTQRLSEIPRLW